MSTERGLLLAALAALLPASCASPPGLGPDAAARVRSETRTVLDAQVEAWNAGDLDAFVERGYLPSEELTFFSGGVVTRGFDGLLERYRRRYGSEGAEQGRLAFTDLECLPLSSDSALVRGRWDLDYTSLPDAGGLFTLLLRRTSVGWRIVHDHTSVDDGGS